MPLRALKVALDLMNARAWRRVLLRRLAEAGRDGGLCEVSGQPCGAVEWVEGRPCGCLSCREHALAGLLGDR